MVKYNKFKILETLNDTIVNKKYIVLFFIIFIIFSCQSLIGDIDEAEDSGFTLNVINFSEASYTGFTFYNGVIDANSNFIAIDSLVYNNLKIPNKDEGDNIRQDGKKYSIIRPFDLANPKLTKFNTWAPPSFESVNQISLGAKVSIKFLIHENGKSVTKTPNGIGNIFFDILEDGTLQAN